MRRRLLAVLVSVVLLCSMLPLGAVHVSAAGRYEVTNTKNVTGQGIVAEARKWANKNTTYWSNYIPWEESIYWRTGYTLQGQTSFDCSGFVSRVLNDCGFRSSNYTPPYGSCILSEKYGSGFIGISPEEVLNYGEDISDAVLKAKAGDFSGLQPGDIIGWMNGDDRHVLIYAGLNNGVPWMVEFTGSGYLDRAVTADYQNRFQKGARVTNLGNSPSGLVPEQFNSHCEIKVTSKNTYIKSKPCSEDSDPESVNVEVAQKGDVYEAIKLCKNKWGKLWYQVKTKNGESGYMYAGDTVFVSQRSDDVWVKKMNVPKSLEKGNSFSIGGTVGATYSSIGRVQVWVSGYSDGVDYLYGHEWTDVSTYHLSGSAVDNMLNFGALKTGKYLITLRVGVTTYYAIDGETVDTKIREGISLYGATFTVVNASCNHNYSVTTVSPSCTEGGYSIYTCTYCGYEYIDDYTDPRGHNYCVTLVQPTCTEGGYTEYWCQRCGHSYTADYVDAIGHTFWMEEIAATCQEYGKYIYHCENCMYSYEEKTNVLGEHDYYFTDGYNPTCGENGKTNFACFTCGDIYTVITPATGAHTYDDDYDGTCNVCGAVREALTLPPAVSQINGVVEVQMWVTVPEWAMEWVHDVYDGFLVNDHTAVTKADLMSEKHLQELVQMLNDQGNLNYTVSQLKKNISFRVSCGGDNINATVIDDKNGITVLSLSESADNCTPLILHDSTCVSLGETVYSLGKENFVTSGVVEDCSFLTLGMSDGSLIESVHVIMSDALRVQGYHGGPLVDVNGYVVGIKFSGNAGTAIGSRKIMEVLDSLGISYASSVMPGDANGDGSVNARDAALLQQFVAAWDVTLDVMSADANGDGFINARDVALLQQYVAGWDVTLG